MPGFERRVVGPDASQVNVPPVPVYQKQSTFMGTGPNRGGSPGQVSDEPLTWGTPAQTTVSNSSATIAAAGTGIGRTVLIKVPVGAVAGVNINLNGAATTSHYIVEPGEIYAFATEQAITAIRNGGTDVVVHTMIGTVV